MSILDMLHDVISIVSSNSVYSYLSLLYNKEYNTDIGKVIMTESQYLSTSMSVVIYNKNGYSVYLTINPDLNSQPLEINGKIPENKCSFIENPTDGSASYDDVAVLLINNVYNNMGYRGIHTRLVFRQICIEISEEEDGVMGREIYPLYLDDDDENFEDNLIDLIKENDISAVFLSTTSEKRDVILEYVKDIDIMLFDIEYNEGEICNDHIVFVYNIIYYRQVV